MNPTDVTFNPELTSKNFANTLCQAIEQREGPFWVGEATKNLIESLGGTYDEQMPLASKQLYLLALIARRVV